MKFSVVALASAAAVGVAQAQPAVSLFEVYKIRSDGLCVEATLSAKDSLDL